MFCFSQVSRDSRENVVRLVHQAPRELLDSAELPVHKDRRVTVESPDLRVLLVSAEPLVLKVGLSKNEIQYLSQCGTISLQNLTKTREDFLSYIVHVHTNRISCCCKTIPILVNFKPM